MIRVIALLTAKPGRRDEVLTAHRAVVPAVRAERGCIEYEPVVDDADFGGFQTKMGPTPMPSSRPGRTPRRLKPTPSRRI
jgi:hypothetical protein